MIIITQRGRVVHSEDVKCLELKNHYLIMPTMPNGREKEFHNVIFAYNRNLIVDNEPGYRKRYFLGEYATLQEAKRKYDSLLKINNSKNPNIEFYM